MATCFKKIFQKISKEKIILFFVALFSITMFSICSANLHKICGIYATFPVIGITMSLLLSVKYFIVDSMANDFKKYLFEFIDDYPKKINEMYRKEYLERQEGLLQELQDYVEKQKHK